LKVFFSTSTNVDCAKMLKLINSIESVLAILFFMSVLFFFKSAFEGSDYEIGGVSNGHIRLFNPET